MNKTVAGARCCCSAWAFRCRAAAAGRASAASDDQKAREIFAKVISIPTALGNGKVPEMAEYLAGEFRAAGFPAEDVTILPFKRPGDEPRRSSCVIAATARRGKPILLLAHMDVVTAKREDWERDPFKLIEENGFFFGRGTDDVKARRRGADHDVPAAQGREVRAQARSHHLFQRRRGNRAGDHRRHGARIIAT